MDMIDIKYFNYCKRSGMIGTKSKRFLRNMNTMTNTKPTLSQFGFRHLPKQGAIQKAKQVERKNDTPSCLSRWPAKTQHNQSVSAVTTASSNKSDNSYPNMNILTTRKFVLVTLGFFAVVLFGATLIKVEGLTVVGEIIGFVAALAILALAAMDNGRTKRLT